MQAMPHLWQGIYPKALQIRISNLFEKKLIWSRTTYRHSDKYLPSNRPFATDGKTSRPAACVLQNPAWKSAFPKNATSVRFTWQRHHPKLNELDHPSELSVLSYSRAMMGWLLFTDALPQHITRKSAMAVRLHRWKHT